MENLVKYGLRDGDDIVEDDITEQWIEDLIRGN